MIKVLLVDDEQFIRQGLKHLVDWEKYGYQILAEAENGMDAIHILEETDIDLVFVDIKMPGMTGMELISYVQKNLSRQIRFVILTGYAEFQYARKALQLNVLDYMLKPVQKEELIHVLTKINQDYQQEQQERKQKYDFHIAKLLLGKFSSEDLKQVKKYLVNSKLEKYVSIEFDRNQKEFAALGHSGQMDQQQDLIRYLQGMLGDFAYHVIPMMETEGEIFGAGLLLAKEIYEDSHSGEAEYLENLQKRVTQHFPYQVQVYVGQDIERMEQLSKSFFSIRVARCLHGLGQAESQVQNYKEFRHPKSSMGIREADVEALLEAIKNNQISEIENFAGRIFDQIRSSDMNLEMVSASIYHILYVPGPPDKIKIPF